MRFIDANVFIYAVVKPKGEITKDIADIKGRAKAIVKRGGEGNRSSRQLFTFRKLPMS